MTNWQQNNYPSIMGILNVTPDSFSDGGRFSSSEQAIKYGIELADSGIDIIDIGGESTRPGAEPVSINEEIRRTVPVIEGILNRRPSAYISIDTYRSETADAALKAGASMVNDISGGTFDDYIMDITAAYNAGYVVMHIKGTPRNMQLNPEYTNLIEEISHFLKLQARKAEDAGIKQIIIDPGIGFGKTVSHNYRILRSISEFARIGYPVLIGLSRKSFIGKSLNLDVNDRDTATAMLELYSVINGAAIIRTHNCRQAMQMKKIIDCLKND